uniref:Uncharacterized protein n=1 Tax=Lepeophtheirus salmonis TaxID=72036 RepID=A0A0K2TIM0_LEPSM
MDLSTTITFLLDMNVLSIPSTHPDNCLGTAGVFSSRNVLLFYFYDGLCNYYSIQKTYFTSVLERLKRHVYFT